jgi:cytidylate kinase
MVIAIDGPAGVGKSSVANMVSREFGAFYLNSGNFYRAVTLSVLNSGADPVDDDVVIRVARSIDVALIDGRLFLDGVDVDEELHTDRVDRWVAQHSAIVPVRHAVNTKLRNVARTIDIVAEGRDMTTVVFPEAEFKVFLDASPEVRARRRFLQGVSTLSIEEIERGIKERDDIDRNKPEGSLKVADDALYIDTSDLTIEQVCDRVLRYIHDTDKATRSFG